MRPSPPAETAGSAPVRELLIGGRWTRGSGARVTSINPFNGEVFAQVDSASEADVDAAISAAAEAFPAWSRTSGLERATLLHRLADALDRDAERLALIETIDNGKIIRETRNQIHFAARTYRYYAGYADKLTGETKPMDRWTILDYTAMEPLGVCVLITAWNSPLQLLSNKLAPALATGNTVVIKPSEHTSISTLEFGRLIGEVGFPPGVVNVVCGAEETGRALTTHPAVNKISFTGSAHVGSLIAQSAAKNVIPVTLELGGKSANMIFADADLDRAIPGAVSGIFAAAGQTCVAGSRLLVHRSIYDLVVDRVAQSALDVRMGDPREEATEMGPVAHAAQFASVQAKIQRAREDGARLVVGGGVDSPDSAPYFVRPTVFANATNDMAIAQDEIFGPVLAIIPFDDDSEAIRIANATRYGLAAGIWTKDINRAHLLAKELVCGNVWVNTYRTSGPQAPFGGTKLSGYGRERGAEALQYYTRVKNTMVDLSDDVRDPFKLGT